VSYLLLVGTTFRRLPRGHRLEGPLLAYGAAILGAMIGGVFDHFYLNLTFIHIACLYWLVLGLGTTAVLLWREEEAGEYITAPPAIPPKR